METKISKAEWNKAVNEWLQEQAMMAGEERPAEWPPDIAGLRGGIENKIAIPDLFSAYATCIGDPNPLWRDADYAKNTRWGGIIAPPTFENCIGAPFDYGEIYKLPGFLTVMDAGASREYFTVIRPLDEFTATDIYVGVKEQSEPKKQYRRFIQQIQRTYRNQRHEKVAVVVRNTAIISDAPGAGKSFAKEAFKGMKRPHYSQKELDEIYRGYDDELEGKWRRGAEIRYWEDVSEGENIHPIVAGPLDDPESMIIPKTGLSSSFAVKWAAIKQDLARAVIDPQTGEYRSNIDKYYSDTIARRAGFPYAIGFSPQNEAVIAHAVVNWMGDDGFITRLNLQHHSANFHGDTTLVKGKVARKYVDNREHLVDIDVLAECQDGRVLTKGMATVQLLSKEG